MLAHQVQQARQVPQAQWLAPRGRQAQMEIPVQLELLAPLVRQARREVVDLRLPLRMKERRLQPTSLLSTLRDLELLQQLWVMQ